MKKIFYYLIYIFFLFSIIFAEKFDNEKIFFWKINTKEKIIFLTFDDGPSEYTKEVLKILDKYNIKATFFVLGELIKYRKEIIIEIFNKGHIIGSHTFSHQNFYKLCKKLSIQECKKILEEELLKTQQEINFVSNKIEIKYLRLPNGFYRKWVDDVVKKYAYKVINWSYGCDWLNISEEEMFKRYISSLEPGGIYLFHDGGKDRKKTIKVLEQFIEYAISKGYKFDILNNWIK
ncbi:MAG: polysaccharide deacetylase family protein [Endomicrobiia bacterium]